MKAAVYARVSTLDQEPENQLSEFRRYVEARGWTLTEYVDRDLRVELHNVLATGDVAVARGTVRGTATGRQYGAPVTRRSFEASFFDYVRLEDGLIVERVQQADDQEAVVQELRTRREMFDPLEARKRSLPCVPARPVAVAAVNSGPQNPPDLTKDLTT